MRSLNSPANGSVMLARHSTVNAAIASSTPLPPDFTATASTHRPLLHEHKGRGKSRPA